MNTRMFITANAATLAPPARLAAIARILAAGWLRARAAHTARHVGQDAPIAPTSAPTAATAPPDSFRNRLALSAKAEPCCGSPRAAGLAGRRSEHHPDGIENT